MGSHTLLTWLVDHVVNPALTLLDPEVPPFGLRHEVGLGNQLGNVFGQHHMPTVGPKEDKFVIQAKPEQSHCQEAG